MICINYPHSVTEDDIVMMPVEFNYDEDQETRSGGSNTIRCACLSSCISKLKEHRSMINIGKPKSIDRKSDKNWTKDKVEALKLPESKKRKIYSYLSQFTDGAGDTDMAEQTSEDSTGIDQD